MKKVFQAVFGMGLAILPFVTCFIIGDRYVDMPYAIGVSSIPSILLALIFGRLKFLNE